jgi:hypothetical protein
VRASAQSPHGLAQLPACGFGDVAEAGGNVLLAESCGNPKGSGAVMQVTDEWILEWITKPLLAEVSA